MADAAAIVVPIVFFLLLLVLLKGIVLVRHTQVMIIERLGKYHTTLKPGLHFIVPFIDSPRMVRWRYVEVPANTRQPVVQSVYTDRIDTREFVLDFGTQKVITKDTVEIEIDALVFVRITDPRLAIFKIQNLPDAIELLTQATLRNLMAHMTLDDTFSSREQINQDLLSRISRDAERWGTTITRCELFNIIPPVDIRSVMEQQIRAERARRSTVLQADGEKQALVIRSRGRAAELILEAEGQRSYDLQVAKGQAESRMIIARAQKESIELIQQAVAESGARATEYMTAVAYLDSLADLAGNPETNMNKVVLIPARTVTGINEFADVNNWGGQPRQ
mmetsp:Transcript_9853/g.19650  ORF Transcript_9853/g.19650 Transcript_9853/m.19650 type:complete len:335 (-) Transcript_9853:19-1023(-)